MGKTLYFLIGPKGSDKTHIGTYAHENTDIHFLRVEPIWVTLKEKVPYQVNHRLPSAIVSMKVGSYNRKTDLCPPGGANKSQRYLYLKLI